jgi:GT2 family glycosyltransferase
MTGPRCSVIIPVHNKAALTKQCLESILEPPPETPYEVVVVDDASIDSTQEVLATFGSAVRSVRLADNSGFATACNSGAEAADSSDFLLFLNNDTIALEGWLDALVRYADTYPAAAVVGSKLLFPDGTIQHAGVVFNVAGDPLHIYAGCAADHQAVNTSRRFQVVTGACLLVRRSLFRDVDGFDTDYQNDLEDVDLCLRLGALGHEIHYCHKSVLIHLESASRGRPTGPGPSAQLYRERWGSRVRQDELDYYLEDGLLEVLRTRPDKIARDRGRQDDADVLQARSRQLFELLRETVRMSTHTAMSQPVATRARTSQTGKADERAAAFHLTPRTRSRLMSRIRALRNELSSPLSGFQMLEPPLGPNGDEPESRGAKTLGRQAAYDRLLTDVPEAIGQSTPAGSTVLVVGKGDDRLLRVAGRSGWHFPRAADGRYAGYHPENSEEAIAHLERLRQHGADYIAFPQTSLWWLEYYPALKQHLDLHYDIAQSGEACVIFDLRQPRDVVRGGVNEGVDAGSLRAREGSEPTQNGAGDPDSIAAPPEAAESVEPVGPTIDDELIEKIHQAVARVLPLDVTVLVAAQGDDRLIDFPTQRGRHFPQGEEGGYLGRDLTADAAIARLEESRVRGAEFLLIPRTSFHLVDGDDELADHLHAHYSTIFFDDSACIIFELVNRPVVHIVDSLIPAGARVAVATHHSRGLAGLAPSRAVAIAIKEQGANVLATVNAHAAEGSDFLVLPHAVFGWLADHQAFLGELRDRYRLVTRQEHVCEIYDLHSSNSDLTLRGR